jgi:hypothetical protein
LGRLQYEYGEQHDNAAGYDQHDNRFGRWHEPVTSGDPGSGDPEAEHSVGDPVNNPAGHQLEVILRPL